MRSRLRVLISPANLLALAVLIGSFAALAYLRSTTSFDPFTADGMQQLLDDLGWRAPALFVALVALAVVVSQVPGVPLAIAAGAVWGPIEGAAYAVAGSFLGALVAYVLGRTLGRGVLRVLAGGVIVFRGGRGTSALAGLLFASRAIPLLPFDLISYGAGVSALPFGVYAGATLLGLVPSTLVFTTLGGTLRPGLGWGLALSIVATLGLVLLAWALRHRDPWGLRGVVTFERGPAPAERPSPASSPTREAPTPGDRRS